MLSFADSVTISMDPQSLLFTFRPTAVKPKLGRYKVLKVIRCTIYLSALLYTIQHISGELKTLTDSMIF